MASLYELRKEYASIYSDLTRQDVPEEAIKDTLDSLDMGDLKNKFVSVAQMIDSLEATARAQKVAAKQMTDRANSNLSRAEWLRGYMLDAMKATGMESFETDVMKFGIRKGTGAVQLNSDSLIPDKYKTIREVVSIDKKAIKDDGGCEGAEIVYNSKATWREK